MNKDNVLAVADAIEQRSIPDLGFYMGNFVRLPTSLRASMPSWPSATAWPSSSLGNRPPPDLIASRLLTGTAHDGVNAWRWKMTLKKIVAFMDCDGCGAEMRVQLHTGDKHSRDWDLFDVAVDGCRGAGLENMSGYPSVQGNNQCLCPKCTSTVDAYLEDVVKLKTDRNATDDEISAALA